MEAILEAVGSKFDIYGNRYWGFVYTDVKTNKTVCGKVSGGESNISSIIRAMGFEHKDVYFSVKELPIREFNRFTKSFEYAGCRGEDLANFIKSKLKSN